jgi:hypothetical protein
LNPKAIDATADLAPVPVLLSCWRPVKPAVARDRGREGSSALGTLQPLQHLGKGGTPVHRIQSEGQAR